MISFEAFCKQEYRTHQQNCIAFDLWLLKYADELEPAYLALTKGTF